MNDSLSHSLMRPNLSRVVTHYMGGTYTCGWDPISPTALLRLIGKRLPASITRTLEH